MVYVERLAVHPAYQRKRIASKLLDWTEQKGLELLMERFPETLRTQGSRLIAEVLAACPSVIFISVHVRK